MKVATIILARKGSKRIKNKNIIPFLGKPLIEHTIECAIEIGFPVWLFTDMPEIREICRKYSVVNVRDKSFENEEGIHRTNEEILEYNKEIEADYFILLQATSPRRDIEKINRWIDIFFSGGYDCGFACFKMPSVLYYFVNGCPVNYSIEDRTYNGVNLKEDIYRETGSFYIFKKEMLNRNHITATENKIIFDDSYCIDIDTLKDFIEEKND